MEAAFLLSIIFTYVTSVGGTTSSLTKASSRCGDWKPYKNEKCLMIARHACHHTKKDAQSVCDALSEGLNQDSRLMIVKTQEEQDFLQHFLFIENSIVDNVWLGLQQKGNSAEFEWEDGTSVVYSNWANQTVHDDHHQCVQMASGEEIIAAGLWVRVTCMKAGFVVCERTQTWSPEVLQNTLLNYKLEQERKFNEEISFLKQRYDASQKEIASLKQRNEETEKGVTSLNLRHQETENEIDNLKRNPVPVGFIYFQLPNQDPPSSLWPEMNWTEVSSSYAGLFFRVVGGNAAPFGQIQEGNSSRLQQVEYASAASFTGTPTIPSDGSWSEYIWSGSSQGTKFYFRFRLSGEKVRPRNQAVKIWQRSP